MDHTGWGWFAVFLLFAMTFFLVAMSVVRISYLIAMHPFLSCCGYLLGAFLLGCFFYGRSGMKNRAVGVIAFVIGQLPLGAAMGLYAIPYVLLSESFFAALDWVLIAGMLFGVDFFVLSIAKVLKNGWIHLLLSVLFLGIGCAFISGLLYSERELLSWAAIQAVYHTP